MKPIRYSLLGLLTMITFYVNAQQSRPKLFDRFPNQLDVSTQLFEETMNARAGREVTVDLGSNFRFTGTVISNEQRYANLQTVLIKSALFEDAIFSLSRIIVNNQIRYTGRILQPNAYDGYLIKSNPSGQYQLVKITTESVLQDCSY